jgi:DNA polymerase
MNHVDVGGWIQIVSEMNQFGAGTRMAREQPAQSLASVVGVGRPHAVAVIHALLLRGRQIAQARENRAGWTARDFREEIPGVVTVGDLVVVRIDIQREVGLNPPVPGVGDRDADWLFVGEAPGADEDARGEPFVGQAGRLLDRMLAAVGLSRTDNVYIANVLKCRPPGNRNPEPFEVAQCSPHLLRQIGLVRPKLIVAMGRFAAQTLLGTDASIASLRGRRFEYQGVPLVVSYHPAYLLRNLPDKAKAWEDLCFARATMRALKDGRAAAS